MQKDILPSTKQVIETARHISINEVSLENFCAMFSGKNLESDGLGQHFQEWDVEALINLVCLFNCANFCFWAPKGEQKWTVEIDGESVDGADALFRSFEEAVVRGVPLFDATFLSGISRERLGEILRGNVEIPLLNERVRCLQEAGHVLLKQFGGTFTNILSESSGDAARLVDIFIQHFPLFDDFAVLDGTKIEFHKRAQLNADMINHRLVKKGKSGLTNLDKLTAFADYKVPQMLRRFGVLEYDEALSQRVDAYRELPTGSREEVEIRAMTIWAVEKMKVSLRNRYPTIDARQLDDYLWNTGQIKNQDDKPYHRTRTIYY